MAGLSDLFNSFEGQQALGLLAAGGARSDGANFGQRMIEGLGQGEKWKQQQAAEKRAAMQEQMQQLQMQEYLNKAAQQKKMQGLSSQFATLGTGMSVDGYGPSAPASFDRQGYGAALEAIDPIAGMQYLQSVQKQGPRLTAYKPGDSVRDETGREVFAVPQEVKEQNLDPKIKQYEYAKQGGYKGSFEQFVTLGPSLMAAAQAPLREAQVQNIRAENDYNLPTPRKSVSAQSGAVSVIAPDGTRLNFPNQAAANTFKQKYGGR
jgi:hypothetical protein